MLLLQNHYVFFKTWFGHASFFAILCLMTVHLAKFTEPRRWSSCWVKRLLVRAAWNRSNVLVALETASRVGSFLIVCSTKVLNVATFCLIWDCYIRASILRLVFIHWSATVLLNLNRSIDVLSSWTLVLHDRVAFRRATVLQVLVLARMVSFVSVHVGAESWVWLFSFHSPRVWTSLKLQTMAESWSRFFLIEIWLAKLTT